MKLRKTCNLCLAMVLLAAGFSSRAQVLNSELEELSIYLGWTHQFQFAGYYAAVEQGYFKEAGYDVELVPEEFEYDIDAVIDGKYDYAVATGATLLSHDRYNKLAVLAAIFQQSPVSLIALKSNGINNLRDLTGGDIVGGTEVKAMLISAGVNLDSVTIHGKSSKFSNLISGKYDAITYFITDKTKLLGNDSLLFNIFRPIEYGVNFYGECLYTSRNEVNNNIDRVLKIREAVIRGWRYAINNQDEIISLIQKKYNSNLNTSILENEAEAVIHTLIQPRFYDLGDMQISKWEQMASLMYELGVTDSKHELTGFVFVPPMQDSEKAEKIIVIASIVIALAAAVLLLLLLYNWQLKKSVEARTISLQKANEEMDRFVYSISHDIRSPLSSMQGLINLIKADPDDAELYLDLVSSSIVKLDKYTKDILDYTRNSRAKIVLNPIDLNGIIDKCIDQVKYSCAIEKVEFNKEILVNEPIWTDSWRLEVILSNILGNATKYYDKNKEEGLKVNIMAKLKENHLLITIKDNGRGISKEHLDKIFNMFYRASEDSQGSGLGLFIVKETIALLHGSIDIESEPHVGTAIHILLPNKKVPVNRNK